MILTCPKCATSYTLDDAHLGPGGRNVRCQACRATWFATRPEEPIELIAAPEPVREVKARELPRLYRQFMADKKRLKAITQQAIIWGAMTCAFIVILLVAYVLRVDIVKAFPSTAKAFAMAGLEVNPTGLKFPQGKQKVVPSLEGGRFVVSVTTDVTNITDQINPIPPIRVRLIDAKGNEIGTSLITLKDMMIDPRATRSLSFDVPDPKNLATNVDLSFDLVAMKELKAKSRYDKYYKQAAKRAASEETSDAATDAEGQAALTEGGPVGDEHDTADGTGGAPALRPALEAEATGLAAEDHNAPPMKPALTGHN